ncbi:hypothetical protein PoB_001605700 [Plakobranchus ocellatus]|uniref:Uncharacterized protein n=1 Tax=Plakobranchus ocellatus TaxID=259542 RepID=A0AAV3Z2U5_9GAST|nr:hypothetical protein PoB_001605700 [Plakobranchus ocellatus]
MVKTKGLSGDATTPGKAPCPPLGKPSADLLCTELSPTRVFIYIASPQQGNLRLCGPPSGHGAGGGAQTRDRKVHADLRADSLATEIPTPPKCSCL